MQVTLSWCQKWGGFPLLALFALALYAQNPEQTIRGGNGVTLPPPPPTPAHPVKDRISRNADRGSLPLARGSEGSGNAGLDRRAEQYTQQYLDQLKNRSEIIHQLTELERVEEYSSPALRGDSYFFEKRLASENQASIYVREGWKGTDERAD